MFLASFADKFFNIFILGVDFKYISEKLSPQQQSSAMAFNVNTHFNDIIVPYLNAAVTVNNVGLGPRYTGKYDSLPISFQAGISYTVKLKTPAAGIYDIQLNLDPQYILHDTFYFHSGLQISWYHLPGNLNLDYRVGFVYPFPADYLSALKTGVGISYQRYALDYGVGFNTDLGWEHKISFSFKWQQPKEHRYIRRITPKNIEKTLEEFNQKEKEFDKQTQEEKQNTTEDTNSEMDFDFEEQ